MTNSQFGAKQLSDHILLNLNMPRKDGWQALMEIKAEPTLQNIPLIILSTSQGCRFLYQGGGRAIHHKTGNF